MDVFVYVFSHAASYYELSNVDVNVLHIQKKDVITTYLFLVLFVLLIVVLLLLIVLLVFIFSSSTINF